ncbi:transposable element Tc1 transposase [Trichonephila clavipes]|nr:transposable element Tc1 transposase [Trichonephila clavipes]
MDWPACSPDINPVEHVWDALGRRMAARLHHSENTQQLKQMLIEEWVLLPQEMLHQLVLSMRRRCEATTAQNILESIFEEELSTLHRKEIHKVEFHVDKVSSHTSKLFPTYLAKKESVAQE